MEKTSPAVELPDRLQRMEAIFRTSRKRCPADATDVLLQRECGQDEPRDISPMA